MFLIRNIVECFSLESPNEAKISFKILSNNDLLRLLLYRLVDDERHILYCDVHRPFK